MEGDMGDDVQSDGEDWSRPVDDSVCHAAPSVSKPRPGKQSIGAPSANATGDNLLVSKLGHLRTIIHIDIDCFYAQVEMIRNPKLREKPLGIQQKYIVVTCNYVARECGVTKLMGIKEAKEKCPDLVLVSGEDLTHYREMSYKISEFLQKYTPNVERLGFDENFIDVSEMVEQRFALKDYSDIVKGFVYGTDESPLLQKGNNSCSCGCHLRLAVGSQIAADIREALYLELGITCCAGIAHNKLMSKLVAGTHKPNQQTTLLPNDVARLLSSLTKARKIPGIGWTTSQKLSAAGIHSVVDVQESDMAVLTQECGTATAITIKQLSHGVDDSPVVPYSLPQTISDEDSFKKCSTTSQAQQKIKELLSSLLKRLVEDGRTPHTFRLTVRKFEGQRYSSRESKQCPLPAHLLHKIGKGDVSTALENLTRIGMSLFEKLVNVKQPFHLTLINVAFAKLEQKTSNDISTFFLPQQQGQQKVDDKLSLTQRCQDGSDSSLSENEPFKKAMKNRTMSKNAPVGNIVKGSSLDGRIQKNMEKVVHQINNDAGPSNSQVHNHKDVKASDCNTETNQETGSASQNSLLSFFRKRISDSSNVMTFEGNPTENGSCNTISSKCELSTADDVMNTCPVEMEASSHVQESNDEEQQHISAESSFGHDPDVGRQLPDDIDPDVFAQLPPEVQNDILGECRSTRSRMYGSDLPQRSMNNRKQNSKRPRKALDKSESITKGQLVGDGKVADSSSIGGQSGQVTPNSDTGSQKEKRSSERRNEHLLETSLSDGNPLADESPFKKKKRLFSPGKSRCKKSSDSDTNNNVPSKLISENSRISNAEDFHNQQAVTASRAGSSFTENNDVSTHTSRCEPPSADFQHPHNTDNTHMASMTSSGSNKECNKSVDEVRSSSSSSSSSPLSSSDTNVQSSASISSASASSCQFASNFPSDDLVSASSLELETKPEPQFRCVTGPAPTVPPDMDEDVFRSLPVEIQAELSLQWQFQNIRKGSSPLNRAQEPKKRSPKVSQKKTVNHPTLLKFFRSKNK